MESSFSDRMIELERGEERFSLEVFPLKP